MVPVFVNRMGSTIPTQQLSRRIQDADKLALINDRSKPQELIYSTKKLP